MMEKEIIMAIDPGRHKCGLAVIGKENDILEKKVVLTVDLSDIIMDLIEKYRPDKVLMGSGTYGRKLKDEIEPVLADIPLVMVDERYSTEKGREKYLAANPPRGFMRLVPKGMRLPSEPYDDYAALVLAEQYLADKHAAAQKG